MKQLNYKKGGLILLLFLFLLVFSSSAFGDLTDYDTYNLDQIAYPEWREYGSNSFNNHLALNTFGYIYRDGNNILDSYVVGNDFEPLVFSFDEADRSPEVIVAHNGGFMEFLSLSDVGVLTSIASVAKDDPVTQPIAITRSDGEVAYIFANSTDIIMYDLVNFNNTPHGGIYSGIACSNDSGSILCAFAGSYAATYNNITIYYPDNNTISSHNVSSAGSGVFNTNIYKNSVTSPIIADWDRDGVKELFLLCDLNLDDNHGVCVYNLDTFILEDNLDGISDGGFLALHPYIGGMLVEDIDNSADMELCVTMINNLNLAFSSSYLECYNSDSSLFGTSTIQSDGSQVAGYVSNPVIAFGFNDTYDICAIGYLDRATDVGNLVCVNAESGSFITTGTYSFSGAGQTTWQNGGSIVSFDADGDGYDDIVTGSNILYRNSTTLNFNAFEYNSAGAAGKVSIADANGDGYYDIFVSTAGNIYSYTTLDIPINDPPEVWANFGRNFDNPVCNGTTLRFSGEEDTDAALPLTAGTNYLNDFSSDEEQIWVTLANGSIYTGDLDSDSPYVDVPFNTPGTFYITVCVTDDSNNNSCTAVGSETVFIYVIDGTPGVTCNVDSLDVGEVTSTVTVTDTVASPTATSTATFLDALTGGDNNSKIFIGFMIWLIITISVMVGVASITASAAAVASVGIIAGLGAFIVLTALGILPIWILILFFLGLILLAILKVGMIRSGDS